MTNIDAEAFLNSHSLKITPHIKAPRVITPILILTLMNPSNKNWETFRKKQFELVELNSKLLTFPWKFFFNFFNLSKKLIPLKFFMFKIVLTVRALNFFKYLLLTCSRHLRLLVFQPDIFRTLKYFYRGENNS